MKKLAMLGLAILALSAAQAEVIVYKITMKLKVPRVYNNSASLGFRRAQSQKIEGYVSVDKDDLEGGEPQIWLYSLINKSHKMSNGRKVTYADCAGSEVMWRYIGSNRTKIFKNTCIKFGLVMDPSYNIGGDEPDNTLLVQLSGHGRSEKKIKGSVTGQIGCGCSFYGHVSPTRTIEGLVSDITPLYGTFTMKRTPQSVVVLR